MLLGGGIGANAYRGDLSSGFSRFSPSFEAGFKLNSHKKLSGLFFLSAGNVQGQNSSYSVETTGPEINPNKFFTTTFFMLGYQLQYHFYNRGTWRVFAGVGIGLLRYTPRDDYGSKLLDQKNTRAKGESYENQAAIIPVTLGVRKRLPNKMELCASVSLMNPRTDYLDNIGELGTSGGNDQMLKLKLELLLPLKRVLKGSKEAGDSAP